MTNEEKKFVKVMIGGLLYHEFDRSYKRIRLCYKRALTLATPCEVSLSHPLAPLWHNLKNFFGFSFDHPNETSYDNDLILLDYFAMKVEKFAENNLVDGDKDLAAMLHEWKERCWWFNPLLLDTRLKPRGEDERTK